jgi:hypothetical protein
LFFIFSFSLVAAAAAAAITINIAAASVQDGPGRFETPAAKALKGTCEGFGSCEGKTAKHGSTNIWVIPTTQKRLKEDKIRKKMVEKEY